MTDPVAAIDIGTNSTRLLITSADGHELDRQMVITRLGQGVDATGRLGDEAMERTLAVLGRYGQAIARHGARKVRVTATSAARDAANRSAFFTAVQHRVGAQPELLSGEQEAALSFAGATADIEATGPVVVVDIGGGSTEFVFGREAPEALISVDMGCVRMTERHLTADPPTAGQLEQARADIDRVLRSEVAVAVPVDKAEQVIAVAGTVTTLAAMALGLSTYDPAQTHGYELSLTTVSDLCARLAAVDVEHRRGMLHEPKRADVIVGGALVLEGLMRTFEFAAVRVSEKDILDGLAASLR